MNRALRTTVIGLMLAGPLVLTGTVPANATVSWIGNSTGRITFTDATTNAFITCNSGTQRGLATALPAGPLNNITASTWSICAEQSYTLTLSQSGTWTVNPTSVSGISLHFSSPPCSFTLAGSTVAAYYSSTNALIYNGTSTTLISSGVTGCVSGLISNGDSWAFTATYQV